MESITEKEYDYHFKAVVEDKLNGGPEMVPPVVVVVSGQHGGCINESQSFLEMHCQPMTCNRMRKDIIFG